MSARHPSDQAFHALRLVSGYFTVLLLALLSVVAGVLTLIAALAHPDDPRAAWPFITAGVTLVAAGVIARVAWTARQLRQHGGAWVARWAQGRLIDDPSGTVEGRLVLITQGLARHSNVPRPDIYVLEREDSINAFVAGWSARDAALAVTRGALDTLSATELQALVAHEFGHMPTDDMRLNMVLLPRVLGLSWVYGWGRQMMQPSAQGARPHLLRWALGSLLLTLGWPGWAAAKCLQALACDRHEYQADAAAVRATLDRRGLGNTLRKIWYQNEYTDVRLRHPQADALATMLFHNPHTWRVLNTHPELQDRIRRVLGRERAPLPTQRDDRPTAPSPSSPTSSAPPARATAAANTATSPSASTPPTTDFERTVAIVRSTPRVAAPEAPVDAPTDAPAPTPLAQLPRGAGEAATPMPPLAADEAQAVQQLLHLDSDAQRRLALLAFMREPGSVGQGPIWGELIHHAPQADRVLSSVLALPHSSRLPVFETLLEHSASTAASERKHLLETAHRLLGTAPRVRHLDLLRYLLMVHTLNQPRAPLPALPDAEPQLRPFTPQEWVTIAAFSVLLAHLIPTASHTGEVSAPGEDWYYAVMLRAAGDHHAGTTLPPDVHDPALSPWGLQHVSHDPGTSALTHATVALLGLRALNANARAALMLIWVEEALARSHAWQLGNDCADTLRLTARLIDTPLPAAVAACYRG